MAIYTGGKKPRVPRSAPGQSGKDRGKDGGKDRGKDAALLKSKDVPQFAPNFSVYVLPPDIVCLYSEDRKFFLHGELYCAVADAIGAGKSFAQIAARSRQEISGRRHQRGAQAADRRGATSSPRRRATGAGAAAAYWASLGLPPEARKKISANAACAFKRST